MVQKQIKKYYNQKRSKGLDLKEGDIVWLLYKNFKSRCLSKKLDYIKLRLYRIKDKLLEVTYRLDLLVKIKIYLVQHIVMLKLTISKIKPLVYKIETYKG